MNKFSIPKCMSTQHPDNVSAPFFTPTSVLGGQDEITEAYYVFSHLLCDEQMWDYEGKEVDNHVVKKLFTKYEAFFKKNKIGEKVFITLRVPNPEVEKTEAKMLLETLESIPRSFDIAKLFYDKDSAPIFEVILPMTSSAKNMDRIFQYYKNFVAGKQDQPCFENDISIAEWIGTINPSSINVIPLFEDRENTLKAHNIVEEYLENKDLDYQRVFFARSDPAMNYGMISALLLNKLALQNIAKTSEKIGVPFYPILGVGSSPLRGNLTPLNVEDILKEYPSVHTFSLQSAFKFDYSVSQVRDGVKKILASETSAPHELDTEKSLDIMNRVQASFQKQVQSLAIPINAVAKFVPKRRRRKLHVGLFGYSRDVGTVSLPRAITFTASLYSLGVPPELLGLDALTKDDIAYLRKIYIGYEKDLSMALKFYNPDSPYVPQSIKDAIKNLGVDYETDKFHKESTDQIIKFLNSSTGEQSMLSDYILKAAHGRRFLG
ncbi:phosphoenolpyruvate carboxylase [PVC group bacterium (ex Bugula neritina AB1)]|nr:phosphoenolpyruvate carboxylase [PVC group bacterium (ex Bugula neritina AB1)]